MGWTNNETQSITVPPGSHGVPRIFIGFNDPLANTAGAQAAIVYYYGTNRAFIEYIQSSDPSGTEGIWSLISADSTVGVKTNFIIADQENGPDDSSLILGTMVSATNSDLNNLLIQANNITRRGETVYLDRQEVASATSAPAVTGTSALIPGCSVTFDTTAPTAQFSVDASFCTNVTVNDAAGLWSGFCRVDGVDLAGSAQLSTDFSTTLTVPGCSGWQGSLAPGSHTIQLRQSRTAAATMTCKTVSTAIRVTVSE